MAEKLTPQQQEAVNNRGGNLLVSAAAGSGKTKVLVDRLMGYLTDSAAPANMDEFLIITYTKAAAAELRGKIAAKLTERISQDPNNRHLQRQLQRLYLTQISTIHAFCADLLRQYAYRLDIPADFRVADESECRELRIQVMDALLDDAYGAEEADPDFLAFVDTQGLGRNDALVPDILQRVYDSARCHLNPDAWLDKCLSDVEGKTIADASQTPWGQYLVADLFSYLDQQTLAMRTCADRVGEIPELCKPAALLQDTVSQLRRLRESESWDEILQRKNIDFGRLTFPRKYDDPFLKEQIKAVREGCKKGLEKKLSAFADPSEQTLADLEQSAASVRGLVNLVKEFSGRYDALKRSYRILDFGDLEHKTLDLLLGKNRTGTTQIALEVGALFREIMVDEYQDSNVVQDAIFSALSQKKDNLFMVGDVKQSIYQFRLADPGIFLSKYEEYAPAEKAEVHQGRKVLLSSNFRSSAGVISAVNHVFRECMSKQVGGLVYGEEEALHEGIRHVPLPEPEVELYGLPVREDTYCEEAAFVAERIASMLKEKRQVRDGEKLRTIEPEDIVILLRSPGSVGGYFLDALERKGIRSTTGGGVDLLQTQEVRTVRAILQIISNPRQDIYLAAALASPVFAFTADDLALLREKHRRCSLFEALRQIPTEKCTNFLTVLNDLRKHARRNTLTKTLQNILLETRVDSIYAAMQGGEVRKANLQAFFQLAVDYESRSGKGIEGFLEHLDVMEADGVIAPGEQTAPGCVTIMSIHKSKGLEFPVVFLCGLARRFNRENLRAPVLCDKQMGLGLSCVDTVNRVRYPTIAKRAIAVRAAADSLSEEMRVLYVAMTRAKDSLIMTYASKYLEAELRELVLRMDLCHRELLTSDVSCPGEWVLLSALRKTEAGAFFAPAGNPAHTETDSFPWKIAVSEAPVLEGSGVELEQQQFRDVLPAREAEALRESLRYTYPHQAATQAPSKQTATQRKGRFRDEEAAENAKSTEFSFRSWRKPSFAAADPQGTAYGNAMHAALQYIRYSECSSVENVEQEIRRLQQEGFLSEEQAAMVNKEHIARLFSTPLGRRLQTGGHVLREFKFSILDDGKNFHPDLEGEKILLQGVVDCALLEPEGITVIDFKTDHVTEETLPEKIQHYSPQVNAYADAMERIYEAPIIRKCLYFFQLNRFVDI